jgi:hypothetical protein
MGELQSVKTVQLSVRPLFRPNTGPSGGARSTHGAPTATPPRSGAPRIFGFFYFCVPPPCGHGGHRRQWTGAES